MGSKQDENILIFKGCNHLKQKLVLSILSGKSIKITDIRKNDIERPGIREFEVNLIRLIDKITNGTVINISAGGTQLFFQPGLLIGGTYEHICNLERSIGYYLDVLLAFGPFCKTPLNIVLKGITNCSDGSPSVDHIKHSGFPCIKKFLVIDEGLSLKVVKRGMAPLGGGEVHFTCPIRKTLKAIQCTKFGMVKRIRGNVYACKVSPSFANRVVESAKGVLLNFLPDIYLHTDQNKGKLSGLSPGYGACLLAETTENVAYAAEIVSKSDAATMLPEEMGRQVAMKLLDEIYRGGCCDSTFQWLICLYMALGQKNVSKFVTGPLSQYTINFLQLLREFFGITFKLEEFTDDDLSDSEEDTSSNKVSMTCVGIGYSNVTKRNL